MPIMIINFTIPFVVVNMVENAENPARSVESMQWRIRPLPATGVHSYHTLLLAVP